MTRRHFLPTVAAGITGSSARRAQAQPAAAQSVTYKTAGCEIRADVYGASEGAAKPALLWMHGGALILGSRKGVMRPFHAGLLEQGYVIVSIGYRLAPETKLPAIVEDVQDAWKWMHEQARRLGIDRGRIATGGASAGAYLAQMTGFCLNPRPRALVSYFGYGDIVGPWYSQPDEFYRTQPLVSREQAIAAVGTAPVADPPRGNQRDKFYLYCRQNGLWPIQVTGRDPQTENKWFNFYCPIRNITAKYPPTILIHGTADTDVPYTLSKDMDAMLGKAGVTHEFIAVDGAEHRLAGAKPEEVLRVAARAIEFVQAHTV
ncbi:MAG TPA: alpha/beta hydrolase [Bryobacteraceae bacterium]|nr:alpha/beta hydrolase [Bryobacteraceae bacterium]